MKMFDRLSLAPLCFAILLFSAGCGGNGQSAAEEDHEHGPDMHTHTEEADRSGPRMEVDTTGASFDTTGAQGFGAPHEEDHEHSEDTHSHEGGEAHSH